MKKLFLVIMATTIAGFSAAGKDEKFLLDGKPQYVIAKPVNARPTEARAAKELAAYLKKITGADFEIVEENAVPTGQKAVYTGQSAYAANAGINFKELAPEEWIIRMQPDGNLILTGGSLVGIIYSVYDYLELCGVRWYDEEAERVLHIINLPVEGLGIHSWLTDDRRMPILNSGRIEEEMKKKLSPDGRLNIRRKPSFSGRDIYDTLDSEVASGRFKERNKAFSLTQSETGFKWAHGGHRPHHTFGDFASDWPKDKAELFTRDKDGKPMIPHVNGGGPGQICLTNPEARQRVLDKLRKYIQEDREKAAKGGYAYPVVYDISQNDNNNKCTCKDCMAIAEREGSYAATNIDFINWIAKNIAKEYPDVLIRTFAYMYTADPPKTMRTEPNVVIHMAILGAEFGNKYNEYDSMRPIEHPINASTCSLIKEWSNHTDRIRHWQYWKLYPEAPEPLVRIDAVMKDMKFAAQNHISDFFIEYEVPSWNSFFALTRYLGYKLMDDVSVNAEYIISDFLIGYYGDAAPDMHYLIHYMAKRQNELKERIGDVNISERYYLDNNYFNHVFEHLNHAEKCVSDPAIKARIRREYPMVIGALMQRWQHLEHGKFDYDVNYLIDKFLKETEASAKFYFPNPENGNRKSIIKQAEKLAEKFRLYTAKNIGDSPIQNRDTINFCVADFSADKPNAKLIDDPDAFLGKAIVTDYGDKPLILKIDNWMEPGNMATLKLTDDILPPDGKYHWLVINGVKFTNNGRSHLYICDTNGIYCGFYRKMQPNTVFDVFISLKRNGTVLHSDRIILARVQ